MIRENNAGASWCCALSVKLRADNSPLLAEFQRWSGVGELFSVSARGGSAPQTAWRVGRKRDCLTVARALARCPPLGKAARQFDIWHRAVRTWMADGGASPAFPALAADLRKLHRSAEPIPCLVEISDSDVAPFLAGFASAEAHFWCFRRRLAGVHDQPPRGRWAASELLSTRIRARAPARHRGR